MQQQREVSPKAMKLTIILGIYFMLTYLTFLSFATIITYIAEHQEGQYNYGPIVALATNYFVYMIALLFAPVISNFKRMFQISAICHLINYAVYIPDLKQQWGLIMGIIGALFGGYGAAIYWVSQGGYMMRLFKVYGVSTHHEGKYFAVINGIVYCSGFFGAIVTTFGLGYFGSQIYFAILTVLALVSWAVCTFFLDSLSQEQQSILSTQKGSQNANSTVSLLSEDEDAVEAPQAWPKQQVVNFSLVKSIFIQTISYYPKMYYLFIIMVFDGVIAGFISTYLSKLLPEQIRTDLNVGYMLMTEGIGCILGAVISAFSSDKFKVINVGRVGMAVLAFTSALTYINYSITVETVYFPFFVAFWWGFLINYIMSWQSVCCAKINKGCLESFSIVKQVQAISFISFAAAMTITDNYINLPIFLGVLLGLALGALGIFVIFHSRARKKESKETKQ